jgi:hypothetical protein
MLRTKRKRFASFLPSSGRGLRPLITGTVLTILLFSHYNTHCATLGALCLVMMDHLSLEVSSGAV